MPQQAETAVFNACQTLFGGETAPGRRFLNQLQRGDARAAFRHQAKLHHPDNFTTSPPEIRKRQTERFREIRQAYEVICRFLDRRPGKEQAPATAGFGRRSARRSRPAEAQRPSQQHGPSPQKTAIPAIPLEFGMFAYYREQVTYHQLIEALLWQRRQRPTLGALAQSFGWLTPSRVEKILNHRGATVRFGKKSVELGYLEAGQVEALLKHQRSLQSRLGRYFIEKGWLTESEIDELLRDLERHNRQLGRRSGS